MEIKSIAIDGPSGAGKSTLARMAADRFGLVYVDTGAIYRCVGLSALRNGIDSHDLDRVAALLDGIRLEIRYNNDGVQHMFLNGEDVSGDIRTPQVSIYASDVSAMPKVRAFLLDMQRDMARRYDVVMDGRDIGTVVLPGAGLKVFLTADSEVRARRRLLELQQKHVDTTFEEVLRDMKYRDENDAGRKDAPLRRADDAILLDTTATNLDESFRLLCGIIERQMKR